MREPWLTAAAGKEGSPEYREHYQMAESHEHRSLDEGRGKHLSFFLIIIMINYCRKANIGTKS